MVTGVDVREHIVLITRLKISYAASALCGPDGNPAIVAIGKLLPTGEYDGIFTLYPSALVDYLEELIGHQMPLPPSTSPGLLEQKLYGASTQHHYHSSLRLSEALPDEWLKLKHIAEQTGVVLPDYRITFFADNAGK